MYELEKIKRDFKIAIKELLMAAKLEEKDILVVGCSTSEIQGEKIGTATAPDIANGLMEVILPIIKNNKIFLAVQCCEHLNRALVVDKRCAKRYNLPKVTVVPYPHAGGALASTYYRSLNEPVVVEEIQADAGLDIGHTIIGMHLKRVAIPIRLSIKKIGNAHIVSAKVRPKLIGGDRAKYR